MQKDFISVKSHSHVTKLNAWMKNNCKCYLKGGGGGMNNVTVEKPQKDWHKNMGKVASGLNVCVK